MFSVDMAVLKWYRRPALNQSQHKVTLDNLRSAATKACPITALDTELCFYVQLARPVEGEFILYFFYLTFIFVSLIYLMILIFHCGSLLSSISFIIIRFRLQRLSLCSIALDLEPVSQGLRISYYSVFDVCHPLLVLPLVS